jgi:hypothetical protein
VLDAGFIQLVDPDNNDSVSMSELLTAQVAAEKIVEVGPHIETRCILCSVP